MSEKRHGWRAVQAMLGYVLALLLALSLTGACALTLAERLLTDQALHEKVALNERVLDAQKTRVEETVRELAAAYGFAPETVLNLITRESLEAYNREIVAWWMGLLGEWPETEAPFPDTSGIEEAVRTDELFRAKTEDFMWRTIARDDVGYPVGKAIQTAAMPFRVSLVSLAMPVVTARVSLPAAIRLLGMARTGLFGASAGLLALVLLTQGKRRFLFGSAGLLAAFALLATMTAAVLLANLPGAMATYSGLLSLQLGLLGSALLPSVLAAEGALLLVGALLLGLWIRAAGRKRV